MRLTSCHTDALDTVCRWSLHTPVATEPCFLLRRCMQQRPPLITTPLQKGRSWSLRSAGKGGGIRGVSSSSICPAVLASAALLSKPCPEHLLRIREAHFHSRPEASASAWASRFEGISVLRPAPSRPQWRLHIPLARFPVLAICLCLSVSFSLFPGVLWLVLGFSLTG